MVSTLSDATSGLHLDPDFMANSSTNTSCNRLGRKSSKLARNAALKLAQEIFSILKRPSFATITSCLQG